MEAGDKNGSWRGGKGGDKAPPSSPKPQGCSSEVGCGTSGLWICLQVEILVLYGGWDSYEAVTYFSGTWQAICRVKRLM